MKRMILALTVCILLLVLPMGAAAAEVASGTCGDNLTWVLDDEGTLTISGSGPMKNFGAQTDVPWNNQRGNITSVIIEEGVTSIGSYAFYCCSNLRSTLLPESLMEIGGYVFTDCVRLRSIDLPDNITVLDAGVFSGCSNLTTVELPNQITVIGSSVFKDCIGLSGIYLPESLTSVGSSAFYGCDSLIGVALPARVTSLGDSAFYSCDELISIELPVGLEIIGAYAFGSCRSLSEVHIPDSVTRIGNHAFTGCSNLTDIILPVDLKNIEKDTFSHCSELCRIEIPSSVTDIEVSAFEWSGLKEIVFVGEAPFIWTNAFKNVTATAYYSWDDPTWTEDVLLNYGGTITWVPRRLNEGNCGENVFWSFDETTGILTISGKGPMENYTTGISSNVPWSIYQTDIKKVVIESGVTSVGKCAFYASDISVYANLTEVTLPDTITIIGDYAFQNCSGLTKELMIPEGVTSIGIAAFYKCSGLMGELVIPEKVTSIGSFAFRECNELTEVIIPESVTSIGEYAFYRCSGITDMTFSGAIPPAKIDGGFLDRSGLETVWVPAESLDAYTTALAGKLPDGVEIRAIGSGATEGSCGENVFWNFDADTGTLTISGTGPMYDYEWNMEEELPLGKAYDLDSGFGMRPPWYSFRKDIKTVQIQSGVTHIGTYVFYGLINWTGELVIPDSVTSIGGDAFDGCRGLTGELVIPDSVKYIGDRAFAGCNGVKVITFTSKNPPRGRESLGGMKATAYYPGNEAAWTEEVRQNYGGTITWIPYGAVKPACGGLDWFFDRLGEEGNNLWATGLYYEVMQRFGLE